MPATERSFSDVPPQRLYLDTDVLVNEIVGSQPHYARCSAFLGRLAERGLTTIYVSSLTWMEICQAVTRRQFRDHLPAEMQRQFGLRRWENSQVRGIYVRSMLSRFEELLGQFAWVELFLTTPIREAAIGYVIRYNLDMQDAWHLACALHEGVVDFASFDQKFRRVDGLHLWNDLIHAPPAPSR